MAKIARIKSARLQPDHHFLANHVQHSPDTPDTANTSDYVTDTPFLLDTALSSFSGSGIGWLTTDASQPTLSSVDCWLVSERRSWETETHFDGREFMGEISVKLFIRWLPYRSINGDTGANWWTQIGSDGDRWCLFKISDINIHLSIDLSINGRAKQREGHISRTA